MKHLMDVCPTNCWCTFLVEPHDQCFSYSFSQGIQKAPPLWRLSAASVNETQTTTAKVSVLLLPRSESVPDDMLKDDARF